MPQDAAGRAAWQVALEDVQVGAADGRPGDPHDGVGGGGDLRLGVVLPGLLAGAVIDKGFQGSGPRAFSIAGGLPGAGDRGLSMS